MTFNHTGRSLTAGIAVGQDLTLAGSSNPRTVLGTGNKPAWLRPHYPRRSTHRRNRVGLTEKERQVLAQIALGLTLDEVGARLKVSRNTVHTHVKSIYHKLNISTRVEAAMVATRLGLVRF